MSAFIVDRGTIRLLVEAGLRMGPPQNYSPLRWERPDGTFSVLTRETAAAVGQMLWAENVRSVQARYPGAPAELPGPCWDGPHHEKPYTQHLSCDLPLTAGQVFLTIDCFGYQSCETDGWDKSEAFAYCEALRHSWCKIVPGYEGGEWGANKGWEPEGYNTPPPEAAIIPAPAPRAALRADPATRAGETPAAADVRRRFGSPRRATTLPAWRLAIKAVDHARGHAFLTNEIVSSLPRLRSQDGKGMEAVARVRFFGGGAAVWYITELDPETGEAFGWADLFGDSGELGYMDLREIGTVKTKTGLPMERDCHWSPRPLSQCPEIVKKGARS